MSRKQMIFFCVVLLSTAGCDQRARQVDDHINKKSKAAKQTKAFSFGKLDYEIAQNEKKRLIVKVKPESGYKINAEYPWKLVIKTHEKIALEDLKISQESIEFTDEEALIPVAIKKVDTKGELTLKGLVNISVCEKSGGQRCLWFKEEPLELKIKVL